MTHCKFITEIIVIEKGDKQENTISFHGIKQTISEVKGKNISCHEINLVLNISIKLLSL